MVQLFHLLRLLSLPFYHFVFRQCDVYWFLYVQDFVAFFQTNGGLSFGDLVLRFSLAALAGLLLGDLERGLMYFRLLIPRELPSLLLALCRGDSLFIFTVIDPLWFLESSPAWFPSPQSGFSS